jgi:hypothetical protein
MTIGATHLALLDLGLDHRPAPPPEYFRDLDPLCGAVDMVEFEHTDVRLAAINARVRPKEFEDQKQDVLLLQLHLVHRSRQIVRTVRFVMTSAVGSLTLSAVVAAKASSEVAKRKFEDGFHLAAARTPSQPRRVIRQELILPGHFEPAVSRRLPRSGHLRIDANTVRLCPAELFARADPMAVRAADIAHLDLGCDPLPHSGSSELTDCGPL